MEKDKKQIGQIKNRYSKMQKSSLTISIITLSINGLNNPIKRDCYNGFKKKNQELTICYLKEMHFKYKDTNRLKVNGHKKIYCANTS